MAFPEQEQVQAGSGGYERCLVKAVDSARQLLREGAFCDYGRIHAVKSILYATIEQAGMESERLMSAQELLRELLVLVALQADPVRCERQEVLRVLEKLKREQVQISNLKSEN